MDVSAIIPARNEAPRIERVLSTLLAYPGFREVIVVDDGSSDETALIADRLGARVVRTEGGKGKGAAMDAGACASQGSALFFCDADIIGLTHNIIRETVEPVVRGEYDMYIAARRSKVRHLGFGLTFSPLLDGQRAVTRDLWFSVPERFRKGYEIEVALNHVGARSPKGFHFKHHDISQVHKEEKRGYLRGRLARYMMYRDIALAKVRLALEIP